ncbi:MAG: hypothetical protein JEY99_14275 [Spirochaetales bacterium]|nr:hypothetical protein [Spirochaetales bacterium]
MEERLSMHSLLALSPWKDNVNTLIQVKRERLFWTGLILGFILSLSLPPLFGVLENLQNGTTALSMKEIRELLGDLSNHSSFQYINPGVLTEEYFQEATSTLEDEGVYIILSRTGSASSRIIALFTKQEFNHVSLSFDYDLNTAVSYNGGNNIYPPGLNPENIESFKRGKEASILVYRLQATREQKASMIDEIRRINREGSAYNMLGLVFKISIKQNIMFCSQFVYSVLRKSGAHYFKTKATRVNPSDFIEMDYHRNLKLCYELEL